MKTTEKIFNKCFGTHSGYCFSKENAIKAMHAFYEAKMKEITDVDITIASKVIETEEKYRSLPGEMKIIHGELLRIGFIVGATYFRDGEIKHIKI
jgi:hypothetical protein